ncbi:beta-ketoacyl-[acyl-carrier-protein] synthase family protein [Rhodoferax saidenbachensis]|uniref:Nodulation protein E n=1 Tax=Rhodoferax saidenbachensis TaxID=1484693 RepID=A0ABU1ZKN2_9BURK|nr:beta-ketoacyl-[acyl-carrier-protein] synthase family protein [Rhodoferax saidenbachensis]MDR7306110.1 3-oxoacyl-[acyl-carrier-protein] synthase II [Rhodoferax saidenbachensis]
MNTVVVTGSGIICALGADKASSFAAALQARSGIGARPADIAAWLPQIVVAQASVEPQTLLGPADQGLDRATQFAIVATAQAVAEAGFSTEGSDSRRIGVFVGIGFGGAQTTDSLYTRFYKTLSDPSLKHKDPTVMHPLTVPRIMANAAAAAITMRYGLHGPSNTYAVACASSAIAIGEAYRAIRHGYLDAALVVGAEAMLNPGVMMGWNALRVMAKPDANDPSRSCRPFSSDRNGFVIGEGAAALVLESAARSNQRGAKVLAELAGYGCSSDAQHLTAPSASGQAYAMQQALHEANLAPEQIQYVNAHGTATDAGDVTETQSIQMAFGSAAKQVAISSTKSMHGHLIGAAGALELALSIEAMNSGSLPPTAHLEKPDPRCDLDYIPLQARHGCHIEAVMSNSFAFGGSNVSLIARRFVAA